MTTSGEATGKITVLVRQPSGPPRRYRRPLAGLTVAAAIDVLGIEEEEKRFPAFMDPFLVNREEVLYTSSRVLKPTDILSVDDP